jgi:DNA-directed RNA polymerase III subunit RPC6
LSSEDLLVYQIIQSSGNSGIWTKELKQKSNLPQTQISKIFKTLEARKLIKAVKHVAQQNRKVYMLYELEPSREITGGAWYTEHEYDAEFINVLRDQVGGCTS